MPAVVPLLRDRDLAHRLAEAIRFVLANEHYPPPECECSKRFGMKNLCGKRRLQEAFDLFHAHYPSEIF